jgi:hypothetical protein
MAFTDSEVAEALQLTTDQQKNARRILDDTKGTAMASFDPFCPPDQRRKPSPDVWRNGEAKTLALLNADQKRKWDELTGRPFSGTISRPPFFVFMSRLPFGGPGGRHGGHGPQKGPPPGRPDWPPLPPLHPEH